MVAAYLGLLALVGVERLVELYISHRNAARAFSAGGIEVGQAHFRFMKVLHTLFLVACAAEVVLLDRPFVPWLGWPMLGLVVAAQALRYAAILTLGEAWNVRVIVVPGRTATCRGIYRYLRHPNYVAVVLEGFALPLVHGAWLTAIVFSVVNALLLRVRIDCEEQALARYCGYERVMRTTHRFLPQWQVGA